MLRQRMSQPGTMVENKAKATGALGRLPLSQPPQTKRPTLYPQAPGRWKGFSGEPRPNTNTGAGGSAPGAGGGRCTTLHPHHGDSGSLLNTGPGSSRPLWASFPDRPPRAAQKQRNMAPFQVLCSAPPRAALLVKTHKLNKHLGEATICFILQTSVGTAFCLAAGSWGQDTENLLGNLLGARREEVI